MLIAQVTFYLFVCKAAKPLTPLQAVGLFVCLYIYLFLKTATPLLLMRLQELFFLVLVLVLVCEATTPLTFGSSRDGRNTYEWCTVMAWSADSQRDGTPTMDFHEYKQ